MILSLPSRDHLTLSEREILTILRDKEYPDNEIVCDGRECWIGLRRTTWRLVNSLLGMMAISDVSDEGRGARRFIINESGKNILADESNIQRLCTAVLKGGAWHWENGKLVVLEPPGNSPASTRTLPHG